MRKELEHSRVNDTRARMRGQRSWIALSWSRGTRRRHRASRRAGREARDRVGEGRERRYASQADRRASGSTARWPLAHRSFASSVSTPLTGGQAARRPRQGAGWHRRVVLSKMSGRDSRPSKSRAKRARVGWGPRRTAFFGAGRRVPPRDDKKLNGPSIMLGHLVCRMMKTMPAISSSRSLSRASPVLSAGCSHAPRGGACRKDDDGEKGSSAERIGPRRAVVLHYGVPEGHAELVPGRVAVRQIRLPHCSRSVRAAMNVARNDGR